MSSPAAYRLNGQPLTAAPATALAPYATIGRACCCGECLGCACLSEIHRRGQSRRELRAKRAQKELDRLNEK